MFGTFDLAKSISKFDTVSLKGQMFLKIIRVSGKFLNNFQQKKNSMIKK